VGFDEPGNEVSIHCKEVLPGIVVLNLVPQVGSVGGWFRVECVEPLKGVAPLVAVRMGVLCCDQIEVCVGALGCGLRVHSGDVRLVVCFRPEDLAAGSASVESVVGDVVSCCVGDFCGCV